jgi:hypothetical protein
MQYYLLPGQHLSALIVLPGLQQQLQQQGQHLQHTAPVQAAGAWVHPLHLLRLAQLVLWPSWHSLWLLLLALGAGSNATRVLQQLQPALAAGS